MVIFWWHMVLAARCSRSSRVAARSAVALSRDQLRQKRSALLVRAQDHDPLGLACEPCEGSPGEAGDPNHQMPGLNT